MQVPGSTPTRLRLLAPAKLNLFLHITGRREDGYHTLQTVFQLLDYGDLLEFKIRHDGVVSLHCDSADLPMDHNLILQALGKLKQLGHEGQPGIDIHLQKKIPMGAGLGGGSANAAITLLAVDRLWQLNLGLERLCEIGLGLGADVPVFIRGKSAWAEGVGEILQPVELAQRWYLVVTPGCQVSTQQVFSHQQLTRNTSAIKMADFLEQPGQSAAKNDCETVTRMLYPPVDEALKWLNQFGDARMTGTGSSVFVSFVDEATAKSALESLPSSLSGFVSKGINTLDHSFNEA